MLDYFKIKKIGHFYPVKALVSLLAPIKEAEDTEKMLYRRVQDSITTYRSYRIIAETSFLEKFEFQASSTKPDATVEEYIKKRLSNEFLWGGGLMDEALFDLDIEWKTKLKKDTDGDDEEEPPEMAKGYIDTWRGSIVGNFLPTGTVYVEKSMHFKHSDPNRICERVINDCEDMFKIPSKMKPKYGLGTYNVYEPVLTQTQRTHLTLLIDV
jgi:hypothetical protein